MWRRAARFAEMEHELRGALTVVALAAHRYGDAQLEAAVARARAALGDGGGVVCLDRLLRANCIDDGGLEALRGLRVAEGPAAAVLGNLVSNAVEHGSGALVVRIEVVNATSLNGYGPYGGPNRSRSRGRGLRIAARAARAAGGRLEVRAGADRFAAAVELPVER